MARKYTNIISSSGTSAYTGSIAKVVALGANDGEASLSRIEYGLEVQDDVINVDSQSAMNMILNTPDMSDDSIPALTALKEIS